MFGVVPKTMWNKLNPADDKNMCNWAMRCLLVEEGNKLILIDTGIGNKQSEKFFGHYYLNGSETLDKSLAEHGYKRDDITDVFLTHLHFDHCGGCFIKDGEEVVPGFKHATFWSNEEHWQWAVHPNEREKASFLKENILPVKESGRLKFLPFSQSNSEHQLPLFGTPISSSLSFMVVNGHTRAMMLPVIKFNNKTIVFAADLLPSPAHIPIPFIMAYDMFPMTTLNEKKAFLKQALQEDYLLFFEHDPLIECCNLHQTEKGIRENKFFKISELS